MSKQNKTIYIIIFFLLVAAMALLYLLILNKNDAVVGKYTENNIVTKNQISRPDCFEMEADGKLGYFRVVTDEEADSKMKPKKDSYYPPILEAGCIIIIQEPDLNKLTDSGDNQGRGRYGAKIACPCY